LTYHESFITLFFLSNVFTSLHNNLSTKPHAILPVSVKLASGPLCKHYWRAPLA